MKSSQPQPSKKPSRADKGKKKASSSQRQNEELSQAEIRAYYEEQLRLQREQIFATQGYVPTFDNMEPVNVPIDDDVDEVPETQMPTFAPLSNDEVDEIAPKKSTRAKPISWQVIEEEDLVMSYLSSSEDKERSTEQTFKSFWIRVTRDFNARSRRGIERTRDQVYSKWGDINKYCGWFNGFYCTNLSSDPSGANDADIIRAAKKDYGDITGKVFKWEECWQILRYHEKWEPVPLMTANPPPKRTKTNASNAYTTSSEAQFSPAEENSLPHENIDAQFSPRPQKRKGKKSVASESSGTGIKDDLLRHFDEFSRMSVETNKSAHEERMGMLRANREKIDLMYEEQVRHIQKMEHDQDFDRFIAPHDHLTGTALRMTLELKKRIAERWGWDFP